MRSQGTLLSRRLSGRSALVGALLAALSAFFIWTALSSMPTDDVAATPGGYYNHLAESVLQGRLDLGIAPRRELLELPDPYDPVANAPFRLHDVSLFEGRYFLYFGITPVAVLFAPARVFGIEVSEPLAAGKEFMVT